MSDRVSFFYAHGTAYLINLVQLGFAIDNGWRIYLGGQTPNQYPTSAWVAGLDGARVAWDGTPQNDPFPGLVDANRFQVKTIQYPAVNWPMSSSISFGIGRTVSEIQKLKPGRPFMLGGYSQGAAVMSGVYNELRFGSLTSRYSDFLGGVMFGNPRREADHLGEVGGSWSGCWDIPNSTSGGGGSFPQLGGYGRLANSDPEWVEFALPGDIFTAVGDSQKGLTWRQANDYFINLGSGTGAIFGALVDAFTGNLDEVVSEAFGIGNAVFQRIDALLNSVRVPGGGHMAYPFEPPVGETGATCYQRALAFMNAKADERATAPVTAPPFSAGWSTTLLPPSS